MLSTFLDTAGLQGGVPGSPVSQRTQAHCTRPTSKFHLNTSHYQEEFLAVWPHLESTEPSPGNCQAWDSRNTCPLRFQQHSLYLSRGLWAVTPAKFPETNKEAFREFLVLFRLPSHWTTPGSGL